jgi:hypothetical protein
MKVNRLQKLYSLKGTAELLEFISQNPGATQKDFEAIADPSIVAARIEEFLNFGLIDQQMVLTEKGETFLTIIRKIEALEADINSEKTSR